MNVFAINADTVSKIQAASVRQDNDCSDAVETDNCAHDCASCSIANALPSWGWASVDRYTAVAVGAVGGGVEVQVKRGEVFLNGTKGRFVVGLQNGKIKITKVD